jgi:2-keto-4-pentenoate hydratase/2-oxohepta-3-ene-1,7-dioic acid hydratase in catechol pathway
VRPRAPELQPVVSLAIAPREEALTFARFARGAEPGLLLVREFAGGRVRGLDVGAALAGANSDPVDVFAAHGYAELQALSGPEISVGAAELLLPFAGTASQVAVGVNYPAHGEEVDVAESFLFPKQTLATPHDASVPARDHLLDYEIELGFVALVPLRRAVTPAFMGLVLASDYTDRALLMRHVRLGHVGSGEGFTQGKSLPGSLPIGNLLVIPRDYQTFARSLTLELWHNGERRQQARPAEMNWDIARILRETFALEGRHWTWNGRAVALPVANGVIAARTLFLSGTPGGVIYRPPDLRQLFVGVSETFFRLRWNRPNAVVEPYLREAYASGRFLRAGDVVSMRAERLGAIDNRIVAE